MQNPFSDHLVRKTNSPLLLQWVMLWDEIEALFIQVFKEKKGTEAQQIRFLHLRKEFETIHSHFSHSLQPLWERSSIRGSKKGEFTSPTEDPFLELLKTEHVQFFVKNKELFYLLPAARETLNEWLLHNQQK